MPKTRRKPRTKLVYILFLLAIASLVLIYYSNVAVISKWVLGIASMFIFGLLIQYAGKFGGGYGLYLVGGTRGIKTVDKISKKGGSFWEYMALLGLVLGFGLFSYPLMPNKKAFFAFGIVILLVMLLFVLPFLSYGVEFLNLSVLSSAETTASSASSAAPGLFFIITDAIAIITGFSGFAFLLIWYNAASILSASFASIQAGQLAPLASQVPGVAPVIPGIDIPLVAGIISLAILLVIHEFSHGVLARRFKVKLKSIGLLLFGVVPLGAFVEPDENEVNKLDGSKQTKIFSAGISANFIGMLIFFLLMLPMILYALPELYHTVVLVSSTIPGYPANGILKPGMQILSWNGYPIKNLSSFAIAAKNDKPNSTILVSTNAGNYTFVAKAAPTQSASEPPRGLIGIEVQQLNEPINNSFTTKAALFLFSVLALSFMLNFLVAAVNLLPIPGFDGWRIYKANIKQQYLIKVLVYLLLAGLLLNVLPWIPILLR